MKCEISNIHISYDDSEQTLKSVITAEDVNYGDNTISVRLANELELNKNNVVNVANQYFKDKNIDKEIKIVNDLLSLNKNQLKAIARRVYMSKYKDIRYTVKPRYGKELGMYTSEAAKVAAIEYVGTEFAKQILLNENYSGTYNNKIRTIKRNIINNISKELFGYKLNDEVVGIFPDLLKRLQSKDNSNNKKGLDKILKEYNELRNNIISLQKEYKDIKSNYNNEDKDSKLAELKIEIKDKVNILRAKAATIILDFGNIAERNYLAMYNQVINNTYEFFRNVTSLNKVSSLDRDVAKSVLNDTQEEGYFEDENDMVNSDNDDTVDNNNLWDKDKTTNDYSKRFDVEFKYFISLNCYLLDSPYLYDGSNDYNYKRNPLLGTKQTYDGTELLNRLIRISTDINVMTSTDTLIEKLKDLSKTDSYFYGIAPLVERMSSDKAFANLVFKNLSQYKTDKFIINIIDENNLEAKSSNGGLDAKIKEYKTLMNGISSNFDSLNENYFSYLNGVNFRKDKTEEFRKNYIANIQLLFHNLAPHYNLSGITKFLNTTFDSNKDEDYTKLSNFNTSVLQLLSSINAANLTYKSELSKYNVKYKAWRDNGKHGEKPKFNKIEASLITKRNNLNNALIKIVDYISPYSSILIDLNSLNAEQHQGSNLGNNNYLSNLIEQISSEEGFKALCDKWQGISQIEENPIFFGIKDNMGRIIVPGLFIKNADGKLEPNKKFRDYFKIELFDGIKTDDNSESVTYESATKQDYLLTQLLLYFNSIKRPGSNIKKGLTFFLDTPSDALRNYAMSIPPIDTSNLFSYGDTDEYDLKLRNNFFNLIQKPNDDVVIGNIENRIGQYIEKIDNRNKVNANQLANILFNINETRDLSEYQKDATNNVIPLYYKTDDLDIIITFNPVTEKNNKNIGTLSNPQIYVTKNQITGGQYERVLVTNPSPIEFEELIDKMSSIYHERLFAEGKIQKKVNLNSQLFKGYKQILKSELINYVKQLSNVLEKEEVTQNGKKAYKVKSDTKGLINLVHYNEGKIVKDNRLTGNFFKFDKLFKIGDYDVNKKLIEDLKIYGDNALFFEKDGELYLDKNNTNSILSIKVETEGDGIKTSFSESKELDDKLNDIVSTWLDKFIKGIDSEFTLYKDIIDENLERLDIQYKDVIDFVLGTSYARLATEPLLQGDSKFYAKKDNDFRIFLKRSKEVLAGGQIYYGGDIFKDSTGNIKNIDKQIIGYTYIQGKKQEITAKNGFKGITIKNTVKGSERIASLESALRTSFESKILSGQISKESAERIINNLISEFQVNDTKTNDAQSYITFEEWMRRRHADGTIGQYKDLINKINALRSGEITLAELDVHDINARIQVQKNFYYDMTYDTKTKTMYPRQIKNAEFVLIPELLEGTDLEKLYYSMVELGIDQVNTKETSKAANRDIFTFWDDNEKANDELFKKEVKANQDSIENYYYRNLWKQQDFVDHMQDKSNKLALQVSKKIVDNAIDYNVKKFIDKYMEAFASNIKQSYDQMIYDMGWKINENGKIINRNNNSEILDFREFYFRTREEAERLGLDSNFKDYFTIDEDTGVPRMPNYLNINAEKFENIAQAVFNSAIRKQQLPGWHAAQIAGVGTGIIGTDGVSRKLKYHEDENGNYVPTIEIMIPRWSKNIPKYKPTPKLENESPAIYLNRIDQERKDFDKKILKKLDEAELLEQIIYRIPTEGKQSIAVAKVVGFLDESYGSTVVVPNEWVTQTGSDFDIDTIYAMYNEFYYDEKNEKFIKFKEDKDENDKQKYIKYIKNLLKHKKDSSKKLLFSAEKIIKDDVDKDSTRKELKNINEKLFKLNTYKEYNNQFDEILNFLPKDPKIAIKRNFKIINENINDLNDRNVEYYKYLIKLSKNDKLTESEKTQIQNLADIEENIMYLTDLLEERKITNREIKEKDEKLINTLFELVKQIANENQLISFEEFSKFSPIDKENREVKNNIIIDNFINIMKHNSSLEENLSRSNFDDITKVNELIKDLQKNTFFNHIRSISSTLSQIQFFEDAIMGARLKARSVMRDTFLSVCNKLHAYSLKGIDIEYPLEMFKDDINIKKEDDIKEYFDNLYGRLNYRLKENSVVVTHTSLGWAEGKHGVHNRNILGRLITVYSSETTAHILDAVKEGAIFNETEDTFPIFKTLIDLGTDYETAISFLAQPAITKLVNNFNSTKSLYSNNTVNGIKQTLVDILNGAGNKDVTIYMSISELIEQGHKMFKNDGNTVLNKTTLFDAIENGDNLQNQFNIIEQFVEIKKISDDIEKLIKVSNPDKFGAKQTIHETKKITQDILKCYDNNIKCIDEENGTIEFIDALYPEFKTGNVNISKSKYPQLAAFLKYCTIPSIEINSKLFATENNNFSSTYEELIKINNRIAELQKEGHEPLEISQLIRPDYGIAEQVEASIGKSLNAKEYKDLKKYIITSIFYRNKSLLTPITITDDGRLIPSTGKQEIAEKYTSENTENVAPSANYWNAELSRIFGFGVQSYNNIEIKNINNPTKEELEAFEDLSPAQKVDWIKLQYGENAGIFNYIETNYNTFGSYEAYGINYNSMRLEFGHDIEMLYNLFNEAAFNDNKILKLTCVDLVKYAFLVEGFNFKSTNISKIITNNFLYSLNENGGFGLDNTNSFIDELNNEIHNFDKSDYTTEDFIDRFIKQHESIVKEIKFNKNTKNKNETSETAAIQTYVNKNDESIFIPTDANNNVVKSLINKILFNVQNPKSYTRFKLNSNKPRLYKVKTLINGDKQLVGVYLYPIGKLEKHEFNDYSIKDSNNPRISTNYYKVKYEELKNQASPISNGNNLKYESNNTEADKVISFKPVVKEYNTDEEDQFIEILENKKLNERLYYGINNFIEKLNSPVEGTNIIEMLNQSFNDLFKDKKEIIRKVKIDGIIKKYKISKYVISKKLENYIKQISVLNIDKLNNIKDDERNLLIYMKNTYGNTFIPTNSEFYKVEEIIEIDENMTKVNEEHDGQLQLQFASTGLTIGDYEVRTKSEEEFNEVTKLASLLAKQLFRQGIKTDNNVAQRFMNKVNTGEVILNNINSINNNVKSIFSANAEFYRQEAEMILYKLERYEIEKEVDEEGNRKKYNVSDPELYNYLLRHPEEFDAFVNFILYVKNFGATINEIFKFNVEIDDQLIQKDINSIKNAIQSVQNSPYILGDKGAIANIFNLYIAKKFADNPLVRHQLVSLRTQFGDINWFDLQFADVGHLNNKQIQSTVKLIYSILDKARDIDAPDKVREFQTRYDEIMSKGDIDINHIIDKQGKYVQQYNDEYLKDKQDYIDRALNAEVKYGKYSIQAIIAKLEKNEWFARNVEQFLVKDYYDELNKITREVIEKAPKKYIEYLKLKDELNAITQDYRLKTSDDKERIKQIHIEISKLRNPDLYKSIDDLYDDEFIFGDKTDKEAEALDNYIKRIQVINNKYKGQTSGKNWENTLKRYLTIISDYDAIHPNQTIDEKLESEKYREAYNWIQYNTIYKLDDAVQKRINEMFDSVRYNKKQLFKTIRTIMKNNGAIDEYGNIDGRKLTIEQQQRIIDLYEEANASKEGSRLSDNKLITRIAGTKPMYTSQFYNDLYNGMDFDQILSKEQKIKEINQILINANAVGSNGINVIELFEHLNELQLTELRDKVLELRAIKSKKLKKEDKDRIESFSRRVVAEELFDADYLDIKTKYEYTNPNKVKLFEEIFAERDYRTKSIVYEDGEPTASYLFYGWRAPLESETEKYIDNKAEKARKWINENIEFVPNEYYKEAKIKAIENGTYKEWFAANHIYNQYTHSFDVSPIWTNMRYKGANASKVYQYLPTLHNSESNPREGYANKNYSNLGSRFKAETADKKYINKNYTTLTKNEQEMLKFLTETANIYAINNKQKAFARNYAPRLMAQKADKKFVTNFALDMLGFNYGASQNNNWHENIGYLYDSDPDFQMFEILKNKESKNRIEYRDRLEGETDDEYRKYKAEVNKENEKIDAENLKIDNALLNNNWRDVFSQLVNRGENYLARNKCKGTLYLLIQDLIDNKAYKINWKTGKPSVDTNRSIEENIEYKLENQTHAFEIMQTFARRIIYEEYKQPHKLVNIARIGQAFTSAKYMMLNLHGGVANISTGLVNILGERVAGDYFSFKAFEKAKLQYSQNILSFIGDLYDDNASTFTNGLIKFLNAVDYDEINNELVKSENAVEYARKLNDLLYSPNSIGEHFMQNSAGLAMIYDSRIYEDENGEYVIGSINDYIRDVEINTLKRVITDTADIYSINGKSILSTFNNYIKRIRNDKKYQYEFDSFRKDICTEFLNLISSDNNNSFIKLYIAERDKAIAKAKKDFETKDKLIDQFEFIKTNGNKGIVRIKGDSKLNINGNDGTFDKNIGNIKFAKFSRKVKYVNKKIHGVYDKLGRASIENQFWGSLAMQYHKHIYPGIMKRYRGMLRELGLGFGSEGYYNEMRQSIEVGSYTSALKFLLTEFRKNSWGVKTEINENGEVVDTQISALESLQNIGHAIIATATNMSLNWNMLSEWERRNIKRALGDFAGMLATALFVIAINAGWDDDELKDNLLLANCLYTCNRMFSEAYMYLPSGMISEAQSLWSSPIAAGSTVKDELKAFGILADALFDENYEPDYTTGQYKGRNKLSVLATRNIPIYRIYQNILTMGARNSYYNGGTGNSRAQKLLRDIGKDVRED